LDSVTFNLVYFHNSFNAQPLGAGSGEAKPAPNGWALNKSGAVQLSMNSDLPNVSAAAALPEWARDLLRCPVTLEELQPADVELIAALQRLQRAGQLLNRLGVRCQAEIDGGLVNRSKTMFHIAQHGIQTLIPGEAISLDQLDL
jgi:hypothetical protein